MGTAKRERQKANRQVRLQELAKEARKEKSQKVAMRVTIGVIAFVAIIGVVYLGNRGGSSGPAASSATTTATGATIAGQTTVPAVTTTIDPNAPTTSTLPKPKVKIPTAIPTTLQVTTLVEGAGVGAKAGDSITVNYVGVLSADGTEFDNSYDRGQPFTFTLGTGSVIKGWDQGLIGAKAGSRMQLDIPSSLAYGSTGSGGIKPNAALTFVIDVLGITPAAGTVTT